MRRARSRSNQQAGVPDVVDLSGIVPELHEGASAVKRCVSCQQQLNEHGGSNHGIVLHRAGEHCPPHIVLPEYSALAQNTRIISIRAF